MLEGLVELRKITKVSITECKDALLKCGTVDKAIEYLKTQHRSMPTRASIDIPGTVIHLINKPPYVIQDTRFGIDNTHLLK